MHNKNKGSNVKKFGIAAGAAVSGGLVALGVATQAMGASGQMDATVLQIASFAMAFCTGSATAVAAYNTPQRREKAELEKRMEYVNRMSRGHTSKLTV